VVSQCPFRKDTETTARKESKSSTLSDINATRTDEIADKELDNAKNAKQAHRARKCTLKDYRI